MGAILAVLVILALIILGFLAARLRKSEERFRLLAEHASDMIAIHSPDGTYLWVSPSVERILGYTPNELIGKTPYSLFHPDDLYRIQMEAHAPAAGGDRSVRITYRIRRKDGDFIWFETLTQPILDAAGEVHQLQTASRDVTKKKRAEDLYRFLIRHLPNTSVFLFDHHYRHLVADGTITGHTIPPAENLEGLTLWQVFPEDMAIELAPFYKQVFAGQAVKVTKSFRTRTYNIHFLPVHGALGDVELGMAVFLDVTEQRATVAALEDQTADLARSNRDLEQFANVASHELKSPLRRISSFAEIMAEEYEGLLSDEADDYLHHIVDGVESLREVIESLLVYGRVQTDRSHMARVDMNEVFMGALKHLQAQVQETGAVVKAGTFPSNITGDEVLLRQLLENLIGNAIKFNTTGRKPAVTITSRRDLLEWEFSVADNGPGLDPAYGEKVFAMFQRLHPEVPGTGIGLALAKKIVGIHRGRIWFESQMGQGTVFKFTLSARMPEEVTQP